LPGIHLLKSRKINIYSVSATAIILFAVGLRVLLVLLKWPPTNSDEATMTLMASNIAYHGQFPIMYYGQDYMGVIEAYLGAFFFLISGGVSLTAMRLGVILLVGMFFIVQYFLTSLLFSRTIALVTLAVLSIGSIPYLTRQIIATGGSAETLLFGSLAFLIALRLSLSYDAEAPKKTRRKRLIGYTAFGIVVGLGIWSDMVGLPLLAMATLLLITICWREILVWGGLVTGLIGGILGITPSLIYASQTGKNPVSVLFAMIGPNPNSSSSLDLWHNLVQTFQVSLPTATGFPFCPVIEYPFLGDNTARTLHCSVIQSGWSISYVLLILTSLIVTILAFKNFRHNQEITDAIERHQTRVLLTTRLFMASTAILILVAYIISAGPVDQPGYHARYIISLIVLTSILIAPLVQAATQLQFQANWQKMRAYGSRVILAALIVILVTGTAIAFQEVPRAQAASLQRADLAKHLIQLGATRIYTDYWTCYSLVLASNEKILCGIVDKNLNGNHNRVPAIRQAVDSVSRNSSWLCASDKNLTTSDYYCLPAIENWINTHAHGRFNHYEFDGYVLFVLKPQYLHKY
jgi:hypothetical protein